MKEEPCDCLACMIPASECHICRESKLESERNRAIAERDAAEAKLKALREAAGALLEALPFDANPCIGRSHERMVIATKICSLAPPFAGAWYACDDCAANPPADLPTKEATDLRIAAPLRALRAALEAP